MQQPINACVYIRVGSEEQLSDVKINRNPLKEFLLKQRKYKAFKKGLSPQNKIMNPIIIG